MVITINHVDIPNTSGCRHINITYTSSVDPTIVRMEALHLTDILDYWDLEHPDKFKHYLKEKAKELGLNTRQAIKNGLTGIQIEIPD